MRSLFVFALLASLCVACDHAPEIRLHTAAPAALGEGWTELESQDASVSVGVPPSFHSALERQQTATPTGGPPATAPEGATPEEAAAVKRFTEDINNMSADMENAQLKETSEKMQREGLVVLAWIYGAPTPGEDRTAISVKQVKNAPFRTLEDAAKREKENMPGDVPTDKVSLPIGDAVRLTAKYRNMIGDDLCDIRYVLLDAGDEYVLRLVATNGASNIEPFADEVAQSLRIKPKPD